MDDSEKCASNKSNNMMNNLIIISTRVKMLMDIAVILEGRCNDPDNIFEEQCKDVLTKWSSLKASLDTLRNYLKEQMEQIDSLAEHVRSLRELRKHIDYTKNQLPVKLVPTIEMNHSMLDSNGLTNAYLNDISPIPSSWSQLDSPAVNLGDKFPINRGKEAVKKSPNIPSITYVTDAEMNAVPKYMRGRLTASAVNKLIESFNEVYKKKYELIAKPKKTVKPKDLDCYCNWKRDENMEPKGTFFITVKDINIIGNMKMDKCSFNIVTILRHLKRIRETRHTNGEVHFIIF